MKVESTQRSSIKTSSLLPSRSQAPRGQCILTHQCAPTTLQLTPYAYSLCLILCTSLSKLSFCPPIQTSSGSSSSTYHDHLRGPSSQRILVLKKWEEATFFNTRMSKKNHRGDLHSNHQLISNNMFANFCLSNKSLFFQLHKGGESKLEILYWTLCIQQQLLHQLLIQ